MAILQIGARRFDIEVAIFDKDGTLIDFHCLWGPRAVRAIGALAQHCEASLALRQALFDTIGYDTRRARTLGSGPLATAPLARINTVMATVLYQHGFSWEDAERRIAESFSTPMNAPPDPPMIQPRGDVPGLFQRLREAGVQRAIATTDDRAPTLAALQHLGIDGTVDLVLCGDDRAVAKKPSVDVIAHISQHLDTTPARMLFAGDTVSDLSMACAAGIGCRVAMCGGAGRAEDLLPFAHVLAASLDEFSIEPRQRGASGSGG